MPQDNFAVVPFTGGSQPLGSPATGTNGLLIPGAEDVTKSFVINAKARMASYYDTEVMSATVTQYEFFAGTPPSSKADANWPSNPLPGAYPRGVYGVKIEVTAPIITGEFTTATSSATPNGITGWKNAINPAAIAANLTRGYVELLADQSETKLFEGHISEFFNVDTNVAGTATSSTTALVVAALKSKMVRLKQPALIGQNQTFKVRVTLKDVSAIPNGTQQTAHGLELGLRVTLYTAEVVS